jgi:hypothetical protein
MSMETLRGPGGAVIGYIQKLSEGQWNILNKNQSLVARETPAGTFTASGKFIGKGRLGLTLLGR